MRLYSTLKPLSETFGKNHFRYIKEMRERDTDIVSMYLHGKSIQEIIDKHGITKARIFTILHRCLEWQKEER